MRAYFFTMCLALIAVFPVSAQKSKRPPARPAQEKSSPRPTVVEKAKTAKGRVVLLFSDGTYAFDESEPQAEGPQAGSIDITAGILYKSGDAKPVSRCQFFLLKRRLGEILADEKFEFLTPDSARNSRKTVQERLEIDFGLAVYASDTSSFNGWLSRARGVLEKQAAAVFETDFQGKATINNIEPGTYFIAGAYKTPRGVALWTTSVTVKAGANTVFLDQSNAAMAL